MGNLNDAQFAEAVNAGGMSRRIKDNSPGPRSGFYVSTPDAQKVFTGGVSAGQVALHKQEILSKRGSGFSRYQGGWGDEDTGKTYLDHSIRVPSLGAALTLGRQWKQLSIYDATNDTTHSERRAAPRSAARLTALSHAEKPKR